MLRGNNLRPQLWNRLKQFLQPGVRRLHTRMSPWHRQLRRKSIELVDAYQVQPWFRKIPNERPQNYDLLKWISKRVPRHGLIVEIGSGLGQNFVELSRHGFSRFLGVDIDEKALAGARELLAAYGLTADLRHQDGQEPLDLPETAWVILPLNWTYRTPDLEPIFANAWSDLCPGGFLIIDIIDKKYELTDHSLDLRLPQGQRRPTEYPYRYSLAEVKKIGQKHGFQLLESKHHYWPRFVAYFQKRADATAQF